MLRIRAIRSASLPMLCGVLSSIGSDAFAQAAQQALPPVTVDAPQAPRPKPVTRSSSRSSTAAARSTRPAAPNVAVGAASQGKTTAASAARDGLNQAPAGQTATTIDRSQFDNRPSFSVSDVLRDSPGISIKQGNGPRDFGISIRGSNARNGFGIRNLVIFDDGFPVTQPDGLSRSDLIDPHAYGAIDVIRGPSSALYGNYATGGALNFRTRPGRRSRLVVEKSFVPDIARSHIFYRRRVIDCATDLESVSQSMSSRYLICNASVGAAQSAYAAMPAKASISTSSTSQACAISSDHSSSSRSRSVFLIAAKKPMNSSRSVP